MMMVMLMNDDDDFFLWYGLAMIVRDSHLPVVYPELFWANRYIH